MRMKGIGVKPRRAILIPVLLVVLAGVSFAIPLKGRVRPSRALRPQYGTRRRWQTTRVIRRGFRVLSADSLSIGTRIFMSAAGHTIRCTSSRMGVYVSWQELAAPARGGPGRAITVAKATFILRRRLQPCPRG